MYISGKIDSVLNRLNMIYLKVTRKNLILGNGAKIDWKSTIDIGNSKLIIGKNSVIRSIKKRYHAAMPFPATIFIDVSDAEVHIGSNCRINGVFIHSQKEVMIGNNCVFAAGVNILDSNGHSVNSPNRTVGRDKPENIKVGDNVWVGLNATILKGTTIGDNSIVTTGSVVKGHFPANVIIQGNPAVVVGELKITDENSNS